MPQLIQPYASGTPIDENAPGTGLSSWFSSITSSIPFLSPAEPSNEGVYTDFLGNVYADHQTFSGLNEEAQRNRLDTQAAKDPSGQSGECAWWNVPCKVAKNVSSVTASAGEFISSTLYKTLAIVVIAGVLALFLMSYVQTKGAQLAK